MQVDTAIVGGRIVRDGGVAAATLAIAGGRVAAILDPGAPVVAAEVIDASGLLVLPGLVDAHVHLREPGFAWKEGFGNGTRVAALGGVTTVLVMPTDKPLTLTEADYIAKVRLAEGQCHVDVGILALLAQDMSALPALAGLGVISVEIFLSGVPPEHRVDDDRALARLVERAAALGLPVGISPGDDPLAQRITEQLRAVGRHDALAYAMSRPPAAEAISIARACRAAAETGAAVHLRQISCRPALEIAREYRARGHRLTAETMPHNLLLTETDLMAQGAFAKMGPPLRQAEDLEALWAGLRSGDIDMVVTDHAPHLASEKEAAGDDMWAAPLGVPGLQDWLPLMLEAVAAGRIGLPDLVRICCEAPARVFGLYPRKGALLPGSDADVVLVDPVRAWTITDAAQASRAGRTPFHGTAVRGMPVRTLLRGRTVMTEGRSTGETGGAILTRQ